VLPSRPNFLWRRGEWGGFDQCGSGAFKNVAREVIVEHANHAVARNGDPAFFRGCGWACLGYNDQTLRFDGGAGVFNQRLKILVGFENSPSFTRR
jgi:hypothetical protein